MWKRFYLHCRQRGIKRGDIMAEHVMHKKESKKAPQKSLKEKREQKKAKKKTKDA